MNLSLFPSMNLTGQPENIFQLKNQMLIIAKIQKENTLLSKEIN